MEKEKLTLWIEKDLAKKLKLASIEETGTMKGVSLCVSEAIKAWLKKTEHI